MHKLPESLQMVADVIGTDSAVHLVKNWPPTRCKETGRARVIVYVPVTLPEGHQLAEVLGEQTARLMVDRFGGELLFLASGAVTAARERWDMIARMVEAGMPRDRVALTFDVSERTINRAVRAHRQNRGRGATVAMHAKRGGLHDRGTRNAKTAKA